MASFSDLRTLREEVRRRLGKPESSKLVPSEAEEDDSIRDVLHEWNRIKPQVFVNEVVGDDATRRFVLSTTITGSPAWDDDVSELLQVAAVAEPDTDDEQLAELDDNDWEVRLSAADDLVLFVKAALGTTQSHRLTWTLPHTIKDLDAATATTITERQKAIVLLLLAAELSELISRKASDMADHTMGVDQVDFRTFEQRWKDNATRLRERAAERLTPSEITAGAAGTSTEWETRNRQGLRRISHP